MMTSVRKSPSKTSIEALSAIARYRHQRRFGRVWLIGDRGVSTATVDITRKRRICQGDRAQWEPCARAD
jgi:hypothetical protein